MLVVVSLEIGSFAENRIQQIAAFDFCEIDKTAVFHLQFSRDYSAVCGKRVF
jgi:hypothetical protein